MKTLTTMLLLLLCGCAVTPVPEVTFQQPKEVIIVNEDTKECESIYVVCKRYEVAFHDTRGCGCIVMSSR